MSFAIVILAAGASSRLGRPKQLERVEGQSLVRRAAQTAATAGAQEIVVVIGCASELVQEEIRDLQVMPVFNPDWPSGMGASLSCGIKTLSDQVDCAVVMLCDQPQLEASHLSALAGAITPPESLVAASSYAGVLGVPAAFHRSLFKELTELSGDSGAKALLRSGRWPITAIPFAEGIQDIDTQTDLEAFGRR